MTSDEFNFDFDESVFADETPLVMDEIAAESNNAAEIAPVDFVDTDELTATEIAEAAQTNSEIAEIGKMLKELKSTMVAFTMQMAPIKEEHSKMTAIKEQAKAEYLAKLEAISVRDREITAMLKETDRKMKELQEKAESAERQLLQAVKIKRSEDELARLTGEWDKLTIGSPWREYAKQHQMDGAKKMAWARGMILADVMGLGKTLTAIATVDIVKAKTSEGETWYEETYHTPEYDDDGNLQARFSECNFCVSRQRTYGHYGNVIHTAPPAGRRVLYMSPAELVRNVEPEWIRWAPHRNKPVIMAKRDKITRQMMLDIVEDMDEFVVQVNYEAWRKDKSFLERLIKDGRFDTLILDEAHNLKDRKSMAYRGVRKIIDGQDFDGAQIADPIRYVFPMTGTPILNRPQELYTLLTLVDSKTYPDNDYGERNFLYDYCEKDYDTNKWHFQSGGLDRLAGRISNKFLRRDLTSAGIELPPQTVQIHELTVDSELYEKQAWARKEMREKAMIMLDDERGAITAAAMIAVYTRLRQIETWPAGIKLRDRDGDVVLNLDVFESQKIDYIIREEASDGEFEWVGLLPEVCPNQRAVVYSQFKEPLRELERRATRAGLRAIILDGDTPDSIRQEIKIDFDRNRCRENGRIPKWDVVFANYRVGGAGLNLTDVTQTIILDEEWSPGKRDQAYGRTFRIGQTEETAVHVIRDENTIDTWLAAIIDEKEGMVGGFEGAMGNAKDEFIEALKRGEV